MRQATQATPPWIEREKLGRMSRRITDRLELSIERHGDHFVDKIFTPRESEYANSRKRKFEHLAARFAAKEAALKALGTGAAYGLLLDRFHGHNLSIFYG